MKILHKCDLCESEKLKVLYKVEDCNRGFEGVFNLYKCKNCGLMFLNPQPTFKELEKYYSAGGCSKDCCSYNRIKKGGFWIKL